jgi:hypothetical protein
MGHARLPGEAGRDDRHAQLLARLVWRKLYERDGAPALIEAAARSSSSVNGSELRNGGSIVSAAAGRAKK